MSEKESISRDAPLQDAALENHLRAVSADFRPTGRARLDPLAGARRRLTRALDFLRARAEQQTLTPAARWLVDNARMLEEAMTTLRGELRGAPALPARRGVPCVARFAAAWLSHTDGRADEESLRRAARAWQAARLLDEKELRLLPAAVRRALLLLLSSLAAQCERAERERALAETADDIAAGRRSAAYWERLAFLWQEREDARLLKKLDGCLARMGVTAAELADREHERQARACLWTANAIQSLRALSAADLRPTLEALSAVDAALRRDPAGVYPRMDAESRAMYRERAARLAERFGVAEAVVANRALECAQNRAHGDTPALSGHVGYYLMDAGAPALHRTLGSAPLSLRAARWLGAHAATLYVLGTMLGSLAATVLLWALGVRSWTVAPALLVAGEGFRQLSALCIHRLSPPRRMPRLAPDQVEGEVLVVVPALLSDRETALDMARRLSVLRLANPESRLSYMLLGDFQDGPAAVEPEDGGVTEAALSAVRALNEVWNGGFYYLHRQRAWNERAERYMGRERKRGALESLNRALLDGVFPDELAAASDAPETLRGRFATVITLDADTSLPPGSALELAGMLQHPLNRPMTAQGRRRGCAVIQPRMEVCAETVRTRIASLWGGDGGFDPYVTAFSDVYQNLCGEGSFAGKGVYDVAAFVAGTAGKIRENTVLSHDLLEGALCGASLACDISLYDSQPASLRGWMRRQHRWTRGDWQLLPWLLPFVRGENGWMRNPLSLLNQFKIYDNLRRSLVPAAAVLLIIAGMWRGEGMAVLGGLLLPHVRALLPPSPQSLRAAAARVLLWPYEAVCLLDAAARTLWRVLVSRRRLLEWVPSAQAERQGSGRSAARFWPNWAAAGLLLAACLPSPVRLAFGAPLAALWSMAPLTARRLDGDVERERPLSERQRQMLLGVARKTLCFFTRTVTEATHHLPPDNLQLEPARGIAPRTSPTNIGMYLLACVSAMELGLWDADTAGRRIEKTVDTMESMATWNGHLFNWYDVRTLRPLNQRYVSSVDSGNLCACLLLCAQALRGRLSQMDANLLSLPARLDALAAAMDFGALYDGTRDLFYIGVNAQTGLTGDAHYDLLASESRLLSFLAVMRREVPVRHWRRLGRAMTRTRRGAALLSWSGTLFEYLLPSLFLKSPRGTLLGETCRQAAREQVGAFGGGPWGVSESGYYAFDPQLNYQYKAFGLPRLALRTARAERVIAPYAAALALGELPREAAENLEQMIEMGWCGELGFYEAADFCRRRLPEGCAYRLVKSHMAHHQGMILASICNQLTGGALTRHFHSLPQAEAYALLLQERRPTAAMLRACARPRRREAPAPSCVETVRRPDRTLFPAEAQVLGGGGTTMVLDARGNGYVSHNGVMLTRWRPDPLYEGGPQVYLRRAGGTVFSLNRTGEVRFERGRTVFSRDGDGLAAELTCFVSPLDGAAVQLVSLRASPDAAVELEICSFLEAGLASQAAEEAHPAFSALFVQTRRLDAHAALAARRPQKPGERWPLLLHAAGTDARAGAIRLETARGAFLGRGERLDNPAALGTPCPEGDGETGAVLDACMSLRLPLRVEAGATARVWFVTAAVEEEEKARSLSAQYMARDTVLRALELSRMQEEVTARYLSLDENARLTAQRMASWLLWPLCAQAPCLAGRQALWRLGMSGDVPVVLAEVSDMSHLPLARLLVRCHAYLRALGLWSDLALLVACREGYAQPLRDALRELLCAGPSRDWMDKSAGVYLLDAQALDAAAADALRGHAALRVAGGAGTLGAQLAKQRRKLPELGENWPQKARGWPQRAEAHGGLALDNGYGGLRADGGYVIYRLPPQPWCNVLANERFGTVLTERASGFTFAGNSRLGRLTAFASDPVRDMRGEFLWLRDEETGEVASPFAQALCTHAAGYSRFQTEALGLRVEVWVFVDTELPVKCTLLRMENRSDAPRRVSVTAAVRWLLGGALRDMGQVRCHAEDGVAWAQSPLLAEKAFLTMACAAGQATAGCDGASFCLGGGMARRALDDAGREIPYGVVRQAREIGPGCREAACVLLGVGDANGIRAAFLDGGAQTRLSQARAMWAQRLSALSVRLPDAAMGVLLGVWFPYQTLSSRIRARAGFYQAGGAIGFRDQLQDMLALLWTNPERVRAHLLEAAAHQFEAGDVQHWWHPPYLGVRTRITDDRLFLPYVTAAYLRATQDMSVLEESVPYLQDAPIPDGQEDFYGEATPSAVRESLHEHCLRAVRSVRLGEHGLPLMGAGDWNDGMNAVGREGRGESVFLGFFLSAVLRDYAPFCPQEEAQALLRQRERLMDALETHAWDGAWYLRAWFDDGTPLGTAGAKECEIDGLSQAWAVLAGAKRAEQALDSALARLVDTDAGIVRLLHPPFDGATEPGYIRGYPPGIRENGGQYTHAAAWLVAACAKLGRMETAWSLFQMLLPTAHASTPEAVMRYRVEPYVVAADVAGGEHAGRGGWTWYTGSAALLWSVGMECLLGFEKRGSRVRLRPSAPADWPGYALEYRHGQSVYVLRAVRGAAENDGWVELVDDGMRHEAVYPLKR